MSTIAHIHHHLLPRHSNNYKARLLHNLPMLTTTAFILFLYSIVNLLSAPSVRVLGFAANIPPERVVAATNQKRIENGVGALSYSASLSEAAKLKAQDMLEDDYWAHIAPDGTEPWYFFKSVGYSYRYAGENLARDFSDTSSAIDAWLASPSHRENMLSGKYTEIGVAVVEGDLGGKDTTLIVQLFGTPSTAVASVPVASAKTPDSLVPPEVAAEVKPKDIPEEAPSLPVNAAPIQTVSSPPVVLASQFDVMRSMTLGIVFIMFLVLLADLVITQRKGITRAGGRTFAHLSFMAMVVIILVIIQSGRVV